MPDLPLIGRTLGGSSRPIADLPFSGDRSFPKHMCWLHAFGMASFVSRSGPLVPAMSLV